MAFPFMISKNESNKPKNKLLVYRKVFVGISQHRILLIACKFKYLFLLQNEHGTLKIYNLIMKTRNS